MIENEEQMVQTMQYLLKRQYEAFILSPTGTWMQRYIPGVCKHLKIRCTHGDEISDLKMRRKVCMICGRSLKGPIPQMCFFTGGLHSR